MIIIPDNNSDINENKKYLVLPYINNMSERLGSVVNSLSNHCWI